MYFQPEPVHEKDIKTIVHQSDNLTFPNVPPNPMWTIFDALLIVQQLRPIAQAYGYCVCLGGGLLDRGYSNHDLDLVCHSRIEYAHVADPQAFLLALFKHMPLEWEREACFTATLSPIRQIGPHVIARLMYGELKKSIEFWFPYHTTIKPGPLAVEVVPPKPTRDFEVLIDPQS